MHLQHEFKRNRKGVASIFAMVFFLLIVIIVFASFVVVLNRTTTLEQTLTQTRQVDLDKGDEQLIVSSQNADDFFDIDANAKTVTVKCMLSNTGTLPVEVVRLWVQDVTQPEVASSPISSTDGTVAAGQVKALSGTVTFSSAIQSNDQFQFWFVSARGNQFSFKTNDGYYGVSSVVGSLILNWANFKYYDIEDLSRPPTTLPAPTYGMALPNNHDALIAATLINLDTQQRAISLTHKSLISGTPIDTNGNPHAVFNAWISKVDANTYYGQFDEDDTLVLPYGVPKTVYFGPVSRDNDIVPFNMVLVGRFTTTGVAYGQNIPFVTLEFISTVPTPTPSPSPSPTPPPPSPTPPPGAVNLILNPGFENSGTWITTAIQGGTAIVRDSSWKHTGTYSGLTDSTGVNKHAEYIEVALSQTLTLTEISKVVNQAGSLSGHIHYGGAADDGTTTVELRIVASNGQVLSYYWGTQSQFQDTPTIKYYYMGTVSSIGSSFAFSQNLNQDWLAKWSTGETTQIDSIQLVSNGYSPSTGNDKYGQIINWDDLQLLYVP